jgi:hypothetical protein
MCLPDLRERHLLLIVTVTITMKIVIMTILVTITKITTNNENAFQLIMN